MEQEIGVVTNFFSKISVAAIKLSAPLKKGDKIRIKRGEEGKEEVVLEQVVGSMQIDKQVVSEAKAGDEIGTKLDGRAHDGNKVFKVKEE